MEPNRNNPQDIQPPHRPTVAPGRPNVAGGHRPVFSDFGPRPHRPQQQEVPAPAQPVNAFSKVAGTPQPEATPIESPEKLETPESPATSKAHEPHETAHSGWIGLIIFIVLAGLALTSFLPGKVFESFPGSSTTESTGEQTIGCVDDIKDVKTSTAYTTKRGFPVVYNYTTDSTVSGTCDGVAKTATGGHTSQFNPLGVVLNVFAAAFVAIVAAKIWGKLFGPKRQKR